MKPNSVVQLKHVGWASAGVLVAVLLFFATRSGAKPTPHTPPAPVVEVTSVQQKDVPVYGEWIGTLRDITNLIDAGLVHVPAIDVLPLEDAAQAHRTIEIGHVRGKLFLKVADLDV